MKTLKFILIPFLLIFFVFVGIFLHSKESVAFFSDIVFREGNKIRKWKSDIRVELDCVSLNDSNCVVLTDRIISILTPLIKPLKIYRVEKNGNLIIHANVDNTPANQGIGYTVVNKFNLLSESIHKADIYIF